MRSGLDCQIWLSFVGAGYTAHSWSTWPSWRDSPAPVPQVGCLGGTARETHRLFQQSRESWSRSSPGACKSRTRSVRTKSFSSHSIWPHQLVSYLIDHCILVQMLRRGCCSLRGEHNQLNSYFQAQPTLFNKCFMPFSSKHLQWPKRSYPCHFTTLEPVYYYYHQMSLGNRLRQIICRGFIMSFACCFGMIMLIIDCYQSLRRHS